MQKSLTHSRLGVKILDSWRTKRILDPNLVDEILSSLGNREESLHLVSSVPSKSREAVDFPKDEVLRRFEEDRERVCFIVVNHCGEPLLTMSSYLSTSSCVRSVGTSPFQHNLSTPWRRNRYFPNYHPHCPFSLPSLPYHRPLPPPLPEAFQQNQLRLIPPLHHKSHRVRR